MALCLQNQSFCSCFSFCLVLEAPLRICLLLGYLCLLGEITFKVCLNQSRTHCNVFWRWQMHWCVYLGWPWRTNFQQFSCHTQFRPAYHFECKRAQMQHLNIIIIHRFLPCVSLCIWAYCTLFNGVFKCMYWILQHWTKLSSPLWTNFICLSAFQLKWRFVCVFKVLESQNHFLHNCYISSKSL